ncbi:hypothetical protein KIH86_00255 [Paenibacillus sp. HN-1]|uniref:hypothetical protein n=1 Tax=Paenibacillus TaxID=44249 RepID=UPI001CA9C3FE|nr:MULTISPECIES: hypothetical protein [Paenibacillus]MBY9082126.1 hypothetical protein [Paenibacillus sp. CGMCC 1.18879]MBY9082678.1 hypothetical protein [Paenibacillus sinensis]
MKWVKRGLGICLIAVLSGCLTILTTGVVVNAYVRSVMNEVGLKVETPGPGFGGMLSALLGTGGSKTADKSNAAAKDKKDGSQTALGTAGAVPTPSASASFEEAVPTASSNSGGAVSAATTKQGSGGTAGGGQAQDDALPVMGAVSEDSTAGTDQQLVVTPDDMKDLKKNLPSEDKVSIFNILMKKVPQDEMQKISADMENGLTEQEVADIQSIISKYVTQDEYNKLMAMLTADSSTP